MVEPTAELRDDVQRIIIDDILRLALPLLAGASAVGVVLGAVSDNPIRMGTPLIGILICLAAWTLNRRGQAHRAVQAVLVGYGASALFAMTFNGGLRAPASALLLALVAMMGWVYGRKAATRATLLIIAGVFGIGLLSKFAVLREVTAPPPLVHAGFMSLYLLLIWITTAYPQERLREALSHSLERETALQNEQQRREASDLAFRAVFEHAAHVMMLLDAKGTVVDVNRAALTFLGLEQREGITGRSLLDAAVWPTSARGQLGVVLGRALAAQADALRCEFSSEDGTPRTFEFTFAPSLTRETLRYVIVDGRDISEQLEAERTRHRARRLELVGQLAGGVAHDFNNVLAAILSSSEVVKAELRGSGALSTGVCDSLDTISAAGMRASDLTKRLLTFARRAPIEKRALSMHELITSTSKLLAHSLPSRVTMVTALQAPRDTVEADPASVESMLINLAINARDAMPEGGTLTVSTSVVGNTLRVSVRDTGTGVAPEHLDRIFEPFFTTKADGTGIGLASVFGAMQSHGGTVHVSSELKRGTLFELDFPLVSLRVVPNAEQPQATELSGLCALVVDDEPALRRVMNRMLLPMGIESVLAGDAEAGLVEFEKAPERFDLAVLDIVLPGRSGPELAVDLLARAPTLKVLFVSGYSRDEDLSTLPSHRIALLSKPFTPEALRAALVGLQPIGREKSAERHAHAG